MFTSSPVERKTRSAFRPAATARAWSVEAAYDCVNETPLPSVVCCQAWMIFPYTVFGVEYATTDRLPSLLDAPAIAVAVSAARTTQEARTIRLIDTSYLSTFSTDMMEITRGPGRRQARTAPVAGRATWSPQVWESSQRGKDVRAAGALRGALAVSTKAVRRL